MKYSLNGISTPFGGISWDKEITGKDRLKYLFLFLESKRILTNPIEMEIPEQCVQSVLEIKSVLIEITKDVSVSDIDLDAIRSMVNACNTYLDDINKMNLPHIVYKNDGQWEDSAFNIAMKNFRSKFRSSIALIEKSNKIKFEKIIPEKW